MIRGLKTIVTDYETEGTQLFLAVMLLLWGAWCLCPWHSFALAKQFEWLLSIAPQQVWGALMFALGLFEWYCVTRRGRVWRRRAALLCATWWAFMAGSITYANWRAAGTILFPYLCCTHVLIATRLWR